MTNHPRNSPNCASSEICNVKKIRQRDDQTRSGVLISNVKKTRQRYKLSNNLNKASSEICIYIIVLCIDIK